MPPAGDQVFKHISLGRTFLIQSSRPAYSVALGHPHGGNGGGVGGGTLYLKSHQALVEGSSGGRGEESIPHTWNFPL